MDTSRPYADVIPGPRGQLFAALAQLEEPVTVRGLARLANVSAQRALTIVHELTDAGLVLSERAGSALMVSLNRHHLAAGPIIDLTTMRKRLVMRLAQELDTWTNLAGAWLFGSTARSEGDRSSDIDILLVTTGALDDPGWIEATDQLRDHVRVWTGNEPELVEHSRQSFLQLGTMENSLIDALRTEGLPLTPASRALLRRTAA